MKTLRLEIKTLRLLFLGGLALFLWMICPGLTAPGAAVERKGSAAADLYSIVPGSVDNPDIVWSRNIPVVNEKLVISARVRGPGRHPLPVRFLLEAEDLEDVILTARLSTSQDAIPELPYQHAHTANRQWLRGYH